MVDVRPRVQKLAGRPAMASVDAQGTWRDGILGGSLRRTRNCSLRLETGASIDRLEVVGGRVGRWRRRWARAERHAW